MKKGAKRKAVVTGGAGFIGSHLVDLLVKENHEVHVLDNFSTGEEEHRNKGATYHCVDVRDFDAVRSVFKGADVVFHMAAYPSVPASIEDPLSTHDTNVNGTVNVLLAAKDAGVGRVVYSASSAAYGESPKKFPLREDLVADPASPYGLHKYEGELTCRVFTKVYGIETVSLRYFNVYGPRQSNEGAYASVIGRFLSQRQAGEPLTIVPPGTQTRDYVHVRDVVQANFIAWRLDKVGAGEVINIGSGIETSVNDVARIVGGETVEMEPRFEPQRSVADIAKAKRLLGWKPQISLEEGIIELKKEAGIV